MSQLFHDFALLTALSHRPIDCAYSGLLVTCSKSQDLAKKLLETSKRDGTDFHLNLRHIRNIPRDEILGSLHTLIRGGIWWQGIQPQQRPHSACTGATTCRAHLAKEPDVPQRTPTRQMANTRMTKEPDDADHPPSRQCQTQPSAEETPNNVLQEGTDSRTQDCSPAQPSTPVYRTRFGRVLQPNRRYLD